MEHPVHIMFPYPNNPCTFQKPELDNSSIHRQQQSNAGMSQPQQFIKTEGDGGANTANMPALSPLSGADLNLTASRNVIHQSN